MKPTTRLTCFILILACIGFMLGAACAQVDGRYYFDRYKGEPDNIFAEDEIAPASNTLLGFGGTPLRIMKFSLGAGFSVDAGVLNFTASGSSLPTMTGNAGKWLKTDGTDASWESLPAFLLSADAATTYLTIADAAAGYQPLDADLTAIAALTTTAFGRGLLDDADAAAVRTTLGLGTLATQSGTISDYLTIADAATTYQPLDADLTDLADGSLTGSKVGSGIDAGNVTAGTLDLARLTLASQAEAEAGAINTKLMTPLRVAEAIAALAAGGGDMLKSVYDPQNVGHISGANAPGNIAVGGSLAFGAGQNGDINSLPGGGGGIALSGGSGDTFEADANGGNGGSLLASGGDAGNDGMSGFPGGNGGTLNMSGSNAENAPGLDGGSINTAAGGGSIHTLDGYIQLGALGTRTTLQSGATEDYQLTFPTAPGTVGQTFVIADETDNVVTLEWGSAGGSSVQYVLLGGDYTTSSTTLADVTGMTATLAASGVYEVIVEGGWSGSTSTESIGISLNGSAAATSANFNTVVYTGAAAVSYACVSAAYDDIPAALGNGTAGSTRVFWLRGYIVNGGSSSTLALRARAETGGANSAAVKAGTFMIVRKLN